MRFASQVRTILHHRSIALFYFSIGPYSSSPISYAATRFIMLASDVTAVICHCLLPILFSFLHTRQENFEIIISQCLILCRGNNQRSSSANLSTVTNQPSCKRTNNASREILSVRKCLHCARGRKMLIKRRHLPKRYIGICYCCAKIENILLFSRSFQLTILFIFECVYT